jgi:hypothetical protein
LVGGYVWGWVVGVGFVVLVVLGFVLWVVGVWCGFVVGVVGVVGDCCELVDVGLELRHHDLVERMVSWVVTAV